MVVVVEAMAVDITMAVVDTAVVTTEAATMEGVVTAVATDCQNNTIVAPSVERSMGQIRGSRRFSTVI